SASEIGWCCATQAIGTMLAPMLAGHIADRWFAAQRCLTVLSFMCAVLLWLLASLTTPAAIFAVHLVLWLVMAPALPLSTVVGFAHLGKDRHGFGRIRMWGTIGWVLPGWVLGFWLGESELWQGTLAWIRPGQPTPELADAFRMSAVLAAIFGVYALTLPHTPP